MPQCSRPGCPNKRQSKATGLCEKHHEHARRAGTLPPLPTDRIPPPTEHIAYLRKIGYPINAIAAAAGVNTSTVRNAIKGREVTRAVHDLITHADMDNATRIPIWRAARRVQALSAAGHTLRSIAEATGINEVTIIEIAHHTNKTVEGTTFRKIRDHYNDTAWQPTAPQHPKTRRHNWAVPAMWDNIDDPHAKPTNPTQRNYHRPAGAA